MRTYFRFYYEDEDAWLYIEVDEEGWALRQVELVGPDARPVTAASLQEVLGQVWSAGGGQSGGLAEPAGRRCDVR